MRETIKRKLHESAELKKKIADTLSDKIEEAALRIINCYKKNGKLILFGNGGSAADCQHIETELVHQFELKNRKALAAVALTTNTSMLTAIGNDWGFEQVFERQLQNLATDKDVVIGLSTSGNSMNVIKGIQQAKKNKAYTIALTGNNGGKIKDIADLSIIIPSDNTARIQEAHITIGHILCHLIEENLFKK
ncbi:MAG: D-sedoheptulose 7-phosphate isomerase [archaeon]